MTEKEEDNLRYIHVPAFEWDKGEISQRKTEVKHLLTFDIDKKTGKVVNIRLQK